MYVHTRAYTYGICMRFTCTPRLGRLPLVVLGFVMIILNLDSSKWSINETQYDCSAADSPGCEGGQGG